MRRRVDSSQRTGATTGHFGGPTEEEQDENQILRPWKTLLSSPPQAAALGRASSSLAKPGMNNTWEGTPITRRAWETGARSGGEEIAMQKKQPGRLEIWKNKQAAPYGGHAPPLRSLPASPHPSLNSHTCCALWLNLSRGPVSRGGPARRQATAAETWVEISCADKGYQSVQWPRD